MHKALKRLVAAALEEDIGQEDITTSRTVAKDLRCRARLFAKQDGVLSGIEPFGSELVDTAQDGMRGAGHRLFRECGGNGR